MQEIKSIVEILNEKAEEHLEFLLSKSSISVESIEVYNNQQYIFDLIIVQMFGFLEKKFQDYYFYIATLSPQNRFFYYNNSHKIEFTFNELFALYKEAFDMKDEKNQESKFVRLLDSIKIETIKNVFKKHSSYNNFEWIYNQIDKIDIFDNSNLNEIYKMLCKLFSTAYNYRNSVVHNIGFEFRNETIDFNLLKNENVYNNKVFYLYIIFLADEIINKCYMHNKEINMSDI